jgi:hypothetical protein
MPLIPSIKPEKRKKLLYGFGVFAIVSLIVLGVFARNDWFPKTDGISGKKTGWFGRELPANASSSWNPFAAPLPNPTPSLSKEYLYAGSRLLAVEDANAGGTPTPSPTPYGFESDVAPRFLGDGIVLSTDVTQVRNFVVGLATPTPTTNEFQRADAAPRSTLGDGSLTSGDVTQVQRYAAGLDPLTPAGGPTGNGNGPESAVQNPDPKSESIASGSNPEAASNREVRVHTGGGRRGQTVTLPVFMKLNGDEMAVSFTLEYDAAKLSNPRLTLTGDLPTSTYLTINSTQAGRIGILIDAEETFTSNPRELRIVFVTFDVRSTAATGNSAIRIANFPARQAVADRRANLLETNYSNGNVTITN